MKTLVKSFFMTLAAVAASSVMAGEGNTLISFSTENDFYANGDPVLDGEWYALCWSNQPGGFAGLTTECKPVNDADKVFILASRAKNGRCPFTVFQIDENYAPVDGEYSVYLLDTRVGAKELAGKDSKGRPAKVNSATVASNFAVSTNGKTTSTIAKTAEEGAAAAVGYSLAAGTVVDTPASIVGIDPNFSDTQVEIKVGNMLPSVSYRVVYGNELDKLNSAQVETEKRGYDSDEPVSFFINKEDAKFFTLDVAK